MDEFKFKSLFYKASAYECGPGPKSFGRRAARRGFRLTPHSWENEGLKFLCVYQEPEPIWRWEDEDFECEVESGTGWRLE